MTVPYPYESYVDERHQRDYEIVFSRHWALTREYEVPRHVSTKTILLKVAAALPNWQETFDNHSSAPPAPNNEVYLWRQGDCVFAVVYPASALFFDHHHHRTLSLTAAHMNRSSCS